MIRINVNIEGKESTKFHSSYDNKTFKYEPVSDSMHTRSLGNYKTCSVMGILWV